MIAAIPAASAWGQLLDLAGPALVTQAVLGLIGLGSLLLVTRRFLANDFPAFRKDVNDRLDTVHEDFGKLREDFRLQALDLTRLAERHESLRGRVDRLESREERGMDDTRSGARRPGR